MERPAGPWVGRYLVAAAIAVGTVLSQYVVPADSPVVRILYGHLLGDFLVVYGLPIAAFAVLVGADPLRQWSRNLRQATVLGLGWFGGLSLLAIAVSIVLAIVYAIVDPGALRLLERENPALRSAAGDPWLYVGLSFLIGACEEVIFRGWLFGTWAKRTGRWLVPAVVTSAVFAGVHLYYGMTFGIASPFYYQLLFLLGFAFAATYQMSGGNLIVPAALHGLNDAISFASLLSTNVEILAHYLLVLGGAAVGLAYLLAGPRSPPTLGSAQFPGPASTPDRPFDPSPEDAGPVSIL